MFCVNCGATVRDGSEFCTSCGTKMAVTGVAAAPGNRCRIKDLRVWRFRRGTRRVQGRLVSS